MNRRQRGKRKKIPRKMTTIERSTENGRVDVCIEGVEGDERDNKIDGGGRVQNSHLSVSV